jgi:ADP-ribose pyrophosphatase YjhB (NUDIX family)
MREGTSRPGPRPPGAARRRLRAADLPAVAEAGSIHLVRLATGSYRKTVGAAALIRDEQGRILLVEVGPRPHWGLPGGRVERSETPEQGVVREVREETGLEVEAGQLRAVVARTDVMVLIFACHVLAGTAHPAAPLETLRVGWFETDEALAHLGRVSRIHLRAALEPGDGCAYVVDPGRPGWFARWALRLGLRAPEP